MEEGGNLSNLDYDELNMSEGSMEHEELWKILDIGTMTAVPAAKMNRKQHTICRYAHTRTWRTVLTKGWQS